MNRIKYLLLVLLLCLVSCKTTKVIEIPVETIKTEYRDRLIRDSIYIRDSINTYTKGDTVFKDKIRYIDRTIEKKDTVCRVDSIPTIVTVEKQVEVNKLYWWQLSLMWAGGIILAILIILLIIKIYKIFY